MSLSNLPANVLAELQQRLVASGFSQFETHAEWLSGQGYKASRSAIHRYAMANSAAMLANANNVPVGLVEAKLRCLEIASSFNTVGTAAAAVDEAKVLLKWVFSA